MSQRSLSCLLVLFVLAGAGVASAQITEVIDSTGDCAGVPGCVGNPFTGPNSVAVDSLGNLYVAGSGSDNAFKITPGGTITEIIDSTGDCAGDPACTVDHPLDQPRGITVDGMDNVYVTGFVSRNAFKIDAPVNCSTSGPTYCTITEIIDVAGDRSGNFLTQADGIAVDGAGNVYVTGPAPNSVFKIDTPAGCDTDGAPFCTITEIIDSTGDCAGDPFCTGNPLTNPIEVAVDSADNVYVGGFLSHNAFKIDAPVNCGTAGPTRCTITEIMDSTGDCAGDPSCTAGNALNGPIGLAVDANDNVYVGGFNSDNAFRIAAPGACSTAGPSFCTITEIIDSTGDCAGDPSCTAGNPLARPQRDSVTVDGSGNVYVTGFNSDNAFKIAAPTGCSTDGPSFCTITEIIDSTGDGAGNPLDAAIGVAVDVSNNLVYVAAFATSNVFKIGAANGAPTAVAGPDQSIRAGDVVFLDGSASFDDNTSSVDLLYDWSFVSTPAGSAATLADADTATPSFLADVAGTYVVELVVIDEGSLVSAPDQVQISSDNLPPTADAGDNQLVIIGSMGGTVTLDGSGSSDPEGDALTYFWSLTSKPASSSAVIVDPDMQMASLTPDVAGVYVVTLTVSDFIGPGQPDSVEITATTPTDFAEDKILEADGIISGLGTNQVTTQGNQNALQNFLSQAIVALQNGDVPGACDKLGKAIARTDGCALSGAPDGNGPGRDWVVTCPAQSQVYSPLKEAFDALGC